MDTKPKMTYEKALKTVKHMLFTMELKKRELNWVPLTMIETIDFLETAKAAIEKQIHKKPIKKTNFGSDILDGKYCPYCDTMFDRTTKCCDNCGQALDWSNDK